MSGTPHTLAFHRWIQAQWGSKPRSARLFDVFVFKGVHYLVRYRWQSGAPGHQQ